MRGTHEKVLLEKYYFYLLFKFFLFFINFDAVVFNEIFFGIKTFDFQKKNALVHEEFLFHENFNYIGNPDFNHV